MKAISNRVILIHVKAHEQTGHKYSPIWSKDQIRVLSLTMQMHFNEQVTQHATAVYTFQEVLQLSLQTFDLVTSGNTLSSS